MNPFSLHRLVELTFLQGEPHSWVAVLFASLITVSYLRALRYFSQLGSLFDTLYVYGLLPKKFRQPRIQQMQYSDEKLNK